MANHGMWDASLCPHRCPFPHRCREYPIDLQNISWATTSNDELGLAAYKIGSPCEEEVHEARCFYYIHAQAGAPHLMLRLPQARDTLQVPWQASAEMCLSAIRKLENPPKCRVAIYCTIVQKRHSDPWWIPLPMRSMPAAIYELSMLLKHPVKCISQQGSSVLLAYLQSIWDQHGVQSPSVSEQVVSHSHASILTTSWSFRALQLGSPDVWHPAERLRLQSG